MDRDGIIDLVVKGLGYREDLRETAKTEILVVQDTLEKDPFLPWFLLEWEQVIYATPGSPLVAVPNRFLVEADESGEGGTLRIVQEGNIYRLKKVDRREQLDRFKEESCRPEMYALVGNQFVLAPIPDKAYTIKIGPFYRGAEPLEFETTNLWTTYAPRYLEAALGLEMSYKYSKDSNTYQFYQNMLGREKTRLHAYSEGREHTGRAYLLGDAD
jgi:hypothetical protein